MTINSLSPGFARISYTGYDSRPHIMTVPVRPTGTIDPGSEPDLLTADDTTVDFSTAMNSLIDIIKPQFASGTEFGTVSFWSQPEPTDNPVWVYEYTSSALGTNAGTNVSMAQKLFKLRTSLGGIANLALMECVVTPNLKDVPPFATGNALIINYLRGGDCPMIGRDGGRIVSGIAVWQKTNDALRKKYFLSE